MQRWSCDLDRNGVSRFFGHRGTPWDTPVVKLNALLCKLRSLFVSRQTMVNTYNKWTMASIAMWDNQRVLDWAAWTILKHQWGTGRYRSKSLGEWLLSEVGMVTHRICHFWDTERPWLQGVSLSWIDLEVPERFQHLRLASWRFIVRGPVSPVQETQHIPGGPRSCRKSEFVILLEPDNTYLAATFVAGLGLGPALCLSVSFSKLRYLYYPICSLYYRLDLFGIILLFPQWASGTEIRQKRPHKAAVKMVLPHCHIVKIAPIPPRIHGPIKATPEFDAGGLRVKATAGWKSQ